MHDVYYDAQYVPEIAYRLERFKQKDRFRWNMRCPLCGDSEKSTIKARGYLQQGKSGGLFFYCYNCNVPKSFSEFLKFIDVGVFSRYRAGKYRSSEKKKEEIPEDFKVDLPKRKKIKNKWLLSLDSLEEKHPAIRYLNTRCIPNKTWKNLFFSNNIDRVVSDKISRRGEPRLIFPCKTQEGEVFAYQGRILPGCNGLRYKTVRINDELPLIFGLERTDFSETVYVLEGPIDSLFLKNSLAVCCSNLGSVHTILEGHGISQHPEVVLVYDNQPRNPELVQQMIRSIKLGYSVCIWPEEVEEKDVNDMIRSGTKISKIDKIIKENTVSGLHAKAQVRSWMRCSLELTW